MTPDEIQLNGDGSDFVLLCPKCSGNYLHPLEATVWARTEDAPTTAVVVDAYSGKIAIHQLPDDGKSRLPDGRMNPSGRRQAVEVILACEYCHGISTMRIVQHKGMTYIDAVPVPGLVWNADSDDGPAYGPPKREDDPLLEDWC